MRLPSSLLALLAMAVWFANPISAQPTTPPSKIEPIKDPPRQSSWQPWR